MFHCSACQIKTFQQLFNNLATDKQYYNQTNLYIVYNFHRTKLYRVIKKDCLSWQYNYEIFLIRLFITLQPDMFCWFI
jgi:hypothetical protein